MALRHQNHSKFSKIESFLRKSFRKKMSPINVKKNPPEFQEHTNSIGIFREGNEKNVQILVNKIYTISNFRFVEYGYRTRQKRKIKNFLRSSKKRFQESERFNSSREEPPVVS